MCSYFNPDCSYCKEYDCYFYVCAYNTYLGSPKCPQSCIDADSCKDCENLVQDCATQYHCTRVGGCIHLEG